MTLGARVTKTKIVKTAPGLDGMTKEILMATPILPTSGAAIQKLIDQALLKNPEIAANFEWVKYVPQEQENGPFPEGTNHILILQKVDEHGKLGSKIVVAVRGEGPYWLLIDALLEVL